MRNLTIIFCFFFFSCKAISPCEKRLKQELSKNWKYSAEEKGYVSSMKFLFGFDSTYKDCLYGKDTTYLSKVFGSHYKIARKDKNSFVLEFPIVNFSSKTGGVFSFMLNEKYKVDKIVFVGIEGGDPVY